MRENGFFRFCGAAVHCGVYFCGLWLEGRRYQRSFVVKIAVNVTPTFFLHTRKHKTSFYPLQQPPLQQPNRSQ